MLIELILVAIISFLMNEFPEAKSGPEPIGATADNIYVTNFNNCFKRLEPIEYQWKNYVPDTLQLDRAIECYRWVYNSPLADCVSTEMDYGLFYTCNVKFMDMPEVMDDELRKKIAFKAMLTNWPFLIDILDEIELNLVARPDCGSNGYACYIPKKTAEGKEREGIVHIPYGAPPSTYVHEYMHAIHHTRLNFGWDPGNIKYDYCKSISTHACLNHKEYFAETIALYLSPASDHSSINGHPLEWSLKLLRKVEGQVCKSNQGSWNGSAQDDEGNIVGECTSAFSS